MITTTTGLVHWQSLFPWPITSTPDILLLSYILLIPRKSLLFPFFRIGGGKDLHHALRHSIFCDGFPPHAGRCRSTYGSVLWWFCRNTSQWSLCFLQCFFHFSKTHNHILMPLRLCGMFLVCYWIGTPDETPLINGSILRFSVKENVPLKQHFIDDIASLVYSNRNFQMIYSNRKIYRNEISRGNEKIMNLCYCHDSNYPLYIHQSVKYFKYSFNFFFLKGET